MIQICFFIIDDAFIQSYFYYILQINTLFQYMMLSYHLKNHKTLFFIYALAFLDKIQFSMYWISYNWKIIWTFSFILILKKIFLPKNVSTQEMETTVHPSFIKTHSCLDSFAKNGWSVDHHSLFRVEAVSRNNSFCSFCFLQRLGKNVACVRV